MSTTTSPRRIQRRRAAGWKMPEGAIYVGRPGKWGNPFAVGEVIENGSDLWPYALGAFEPQAQHAAQDLASVKLLRAEDVVQAHFLWFVEQPALMITVSAELAGHDLACWCKPGDPCHADLLLEIANG